MNTLTGVPFRGEFSSANATALTEATTARFTLYASGSVTPALTLAAGDQVTITDIFISANFTGTITVYDGADATPEAGERVFVGSFSTGSTNYANVPLETPHYCPKATDALGTAGDYPKVYSTASGQVDVIIHGMIRRS